MYGKVGDVKLDKVGFYSLCHSIETCQSLNPITNQAKLVIESAEAIVPIRRKLCDPLVNWVRNINFNYFFLIKYILLI